MKNKITEWKLDDEIRTKRDLVGFLIAATEDVNPKYPGKKDMAWLAVACKDYVRIAKQRGWVK